MEYSIQDGKGLFAIGEGEAEIAARVLHGQPLATITNHLLKLKAMEEYMAQESSVANLSVRMEYKQEIGKLRDVLDECRQHAPSIDEYCSPLTGIPTIPMSEASQEDIRKSYNSGSVDLLLRLSYDFFKEK